MKTKHTFTFIRTEGLALASNILALDVSTAAPSQREDAFVALRAGITDWMAGTDAGKEEWAGTSGDFNVGDLAGCLGDDSLLAALKGRGIAAVEVAFESNSDEVVAYDKILPVAESLPEV